jgi:hypothetical protein
LSEKGAGAHRAFVPRWWRDRERRLNFQVAALLLALAFAFMLPGLPPNRVAAPFEWLLTLPPWKSLHPDLEVLFPGGDLLFQQLPWRHWTQAELAAGRFPLWASAPLGGSPLFASYQPGVLHPLHLLWVLMPVGAGLGVIMTLKLWLAGLGMWTLLRTLSLHPLAAGITAVTFMFSSWLVGFLTWQLTSIYILLPWMLWAAYRWCHAGRRGPLVLLALCVAFAIFGGHPEVLFIVGTGAAVWTIALLATFSWRRWLWQVGGLVVAVAIGAVLGAVQLLPFLEALGLSHVAAVRASSTGSTASFHFGMQEMLYWILPRFWGYFPQGVVSHVIGAAEGSGYVGLVPLIGLVLVPVGLVQRRFTLRAIAPWLVLALFAWVLVYDNTVGTLIRQLPGFSLNINTRWIGIISFSVLVLSAFGWDWLARRVSPPYKTAAWWPRSRAYTIGLVLLTQGLILLIVHGSGLTSRPQLQEKVGTFFLVNADYQLYWAVWALGVLMAAVGACALWWAGGKGRLFGPLLLGFVLVVDLWHLNVPVNPTARTESYYPSTRFIRDLQSVRPPDRLLVEGEVFPANSALVFGIPDWRAQDALISQRAYQAAHFLYPQLSDSVWAEYNFFLNEVHLQVAPMLGITHFVRAISPDQPNIVGPPGQPPITRIAAKEGFGLWKFEDVPGFSYLSDRLTVVSSEKEASAWMKSLTWAQVRSYEALVESEVDAVAAITEGPSGISPGTVEVLEYSPGHIRLRAVASRPALLAVAEAYYPGWRASVDDQPAEVLRVNYLSQGVVVREGTHIVELRYEPDSFRYGAILSLLGLGGLTGLALWAWWPGLRLRRARKRGEPQMRPAPDKAS